jgi:hypothetical protein
MKAYILTESDFEKLILQLSEDPAHRNVFGEKELQINHEAYRHFNYIIRTWISKVKEDGHPVVLRGD